LVPGRTSRGLHLPVPGEAMLCMSEALVPNRVTEKAREERLSCRRSNERRIQQ
jgi:hypothetical protein